MSSVIAATGKASRIRQIHAAALNSDEERVMRMAGVPAAVVGIVVDYVLEKALDELIDFLNRPSRLDRVIGKESLQHALEKTSSITKSQATKMCVASAKLAKTLGTQVVMDALRDADVNGTVGEMCRHNVGVGIEVSLYPEGEIVNVCRAKAELGDLQFNEGGNVPVEGRDDENRGNDGSGNGDRSSEGGEDDGIGFDGPVMGLFDLVRFD